MYVFSNDDLLSQDDVELFIKKEEKTYHDISTLFIFIMPKPFVTLISIGFKTLKVSRTLLLRAFRAFNTYKQFIYLI